MASRGLAAGLVALLAVGAAVLGASPAVAADDPIPTGSVSAGKITATNSPLDLILQDAQMRGQLGSPSFTTRAYFNGTSGVSTGGSSLFVTRSDGRQLRGSDCGTQAFGGTGTSLDPFWISTTQTTLASVITKKDSYVLGSGQSRTDLTYTNISAPASVQMSYWVDSYFAGSDNGANLITESSISSLSSTTTAASSFVPLSPGASFAGGYYLASKAAASTYGGLTNKCLANGGSVTPCDSQWDNSMAIGWKLDNVGTGESRTRTYFATFSSELRFADIDADAAVSTSSARVGSTYDYTLTVRNNGGPETADAIGVDFPLPAGVALVSQSGAGSYDPSTGTWSAGDLAFGDSAQIKLTVEANPVGVKTAQILRAEPKVALDVTPFNPTTTTVTRVDVTDAIDSTKSAVTAVPTSVQADGKAVSTVTVKTYGKTGEPMTSGGAAVVVKSSLGQVSNVVDNGDGTYTATVSSSVTGSAVISATVEGTTVTGPTVTFTPGAPVAGANASTFSVTPGDKVADGATAHTATVTLKDANGNLIPGAADRLSLTAAPVEGVSLGAITEQAPGVYTTSVVSTTAGAKTITAFADGSVNLGSGSASFIAGAVSLADSSLVLSTGDKTADGTSAHTATVTAKDAHGNVVPNASVTFAVAGGATGSGTVKTDGAGTAQISITSTTAGKKAVSATIGGTQVSGAGEVSFVAGAVDATNSVFSVSPGKVLADGTASHTATVVAKDAQGNPVSGVTVDFAVPAGVSGSVPAATDASGSTTITLTSTAAGTYSIGAAIGGTTVAGAPKDVTFSAGAAVASTSSWTVTPAGPVTADGSSAYTAVLTARDAKGNPVAGAVFTVDVAGAVTPSRVDWITGADGTVSGSFTSVKTGTYPASVSLGGDAVGAAKNLVFNAGDASTTTSTIASDLDRIKADGSATATVTVTLKDVQGNVLEGTSMPKVVISTTDGAVSSTTDNGDGTYTATLTATTAGTANLSFTIDGKSAANTASVVLINAIAPDAPVVDPTNGSKVTGTAQPDSIVTITDEHGIVIGTGAAGTDGSFDIALSPRPAEGAEISVTATDADGNVSDPTVVTVDAVAPDAPVVDPTNGTKVSGQAEPSSKVVVKDESGTVLGSGTTDEDGFFSFPLSPAAAEGEKLSVTAQDAAGNVSDPTVVTVDAVAPDAPVVDPTNGTKVSGQAEPSSKVVVKDESGTVLGSGTTDEDGFFSFPLSPAAAEGEKLSVTAQDAAGNVSDPTVVTVDAVAPDAPVVDPTNGTKVSGQAEPSSKVVVKDESGTVLGSGTTDEDGFFSFPLSPAAAEGEKLSVTAQDAAGNVSDPTVVTVDAVAPDAPVVDPSNGQKVIGSAEPNSKVEIKDANGDVIGSGTAGTDGSFVIALDPFAKTGDLVTATATDAAGNTSQPTVVPVNSDVPMSPTVRPTNGVAVSGTSEPNMAITVTDEGGNVIGSGTSDKDGAFRIVLDRIAGNGEHLGVIATNEADVSSAPTMVTVDAAAPDAPLVDPTDGRTVTGEAEPGATVTVKNEEGDVIGSAVAQPDGSFLISLDPAAKDGDKIEVTATDPAGNTSEPTEVTVDATAPDAPIVDPTNGSEVTGKTEPDAHVVVTDKDGNVIGSGNADKDGNFVLPLNPIPGDGDKIEVTATDPAGNTSEPTEVTVDAVAPDAPIVDPTDGSEVTGETEPGAQVIVKDKEGNIIGEGEADKDGNFVIPLNPVPGDGDKITVEVTDPAGNTSEPTEVTVDATAPDAPIVDPTNGTQVAGQAEPESLVIVRDKEGTIIGSGNADKDGNFVLPLNPIPGHGDELTVTATDAAGNVSDRTVVTVDSVAPDAPTVDATDGAIVTGHAEPGSTVTVKDADGAVIGTGVADVDGSFRIELTVPQQPGAILSVTATDAVGNESEPTEITVSAAPAEKPKPTPAPQSGDLATTGGALPLSLLAIGSLLTLSAFLLLAVRKRRARDEEEAEVIEH